MSSTRIRALIADGNLAEANDFLGHPFRVIERVIHGDRRGRTIGFPTANLPISAHAAMLPNGAYAVRVRVDGAASWYGGMANIGSNPTFAGRTRRIEVTSSRSTSSRSFVTSKHLHLSTSSCAS